MRRSLRIQRVRAGSGKRSKGGARSNGWGRSARRRSCCTAPRIRLIPASNAELIASRIPGAELVILEGAGHVYHSEQPEEADAAVLGFLERCP